MKRSAFLIILCGLLACSAFSCGSKDDASEAETSAASTAEKSGDSESSAEDESEAETSAEDESEAETSADDEGEAETSAETETEAEKTQSGTACNEEDAVNAISEYLTNVADKGDAKAAGKCMYPYAAIDAIGSDKEITDQLFDGAELTQGVKVQPIEVNSSRDLSQDELDDAEAFLEKYSSVLCGTDVDVTLAGGYEIDFSTVLDDGVDDVDFGDTYCVVLTEEEGYKVLVTDAAAFEGLAD